MQLFCFTFAGGTAAFFNQLEDHCKGDIEFIKLEYSGHGDRMKEPLCHSFGEISEDLYKVIREKYKGGDYALMGYSMGSFSVVDMYYYILQKKEMELPKRLFVSAHAPKNRIDFLGLSKEERDERAKLRTIEFGAVPERLINNASFWRLYLPIYRTDYEIISDYRIDKWKEKISVPMTVFYSEEDTPLAELKEWEKYISNGIEYIRYSGPHFFINEYAKDMMKVIEERLGTEN